MSRRPRRLVRDRRGTTSLELAFVAGPFMLLVFAIVGGAVLFWARSTIQLAAAQTARCVAIGSSDCTDRTAYAQTVLDYWGAGGILKNITVVVTQGSTCSSTVGHYVLVTVSGKPGAVGQIVPSSIAQTSLTARACYPSGS